MMQRLLRVVLVFGVLALAGTLVNTGTLLADDDDRDNGDRHLPPQTLPQGFESTRDLLRDAQMADRAPKYSAWIVESSRFLGVPSRAFMPDRGDRVTVDLPVNVGIIKLPGRDADITLYDSGWKQLAYIFNWNTSCCWDDLRHQIGQIGLNPNNVKHIVFFLNYPTDFNGGHIRAVNTLNPLTGLQFGPPANFCARSPVCGYPPQTVQEILGKVLHGKAHIVDGRHEISDGLVIHPAFRGHTYGSQLLQVHTARGELVFGSDTYSSWEGIRDWNVANIQQTDTIQQFLAYEKCYVLTSTSPLTPTSGSFNNCIAAHEPNSYTAAYPITSNWWNIPGGNCSRAAELALAPGESTHVPASPDRTPPASCVSTIPTHPIAP